MATYVNTDARGAGGRFSGWGGVVDVVIGADDWRRSGGRTTFCVSVKTLGASSALGSAKSRLSKKKENKNSRTLPSTPERRDADGTCLEKRREDASTPSSCGVRFFSFSFSFLLRQIRPRAVKPFSDP